jgi:diacylglycerol kinase (ATP)
MEEMKLIVNPIAASGKMKKRWPHIRAILQKTGADFTADLTEGVGHATELAHQAVADGYRIVVAVGGDGTVNEVVNGLIVDVDGKEPYIDPAVTLGIIPGGTGSDLVRTVGISHKHERACRQLLDSGTRLLDVGVIEYLEGDQKRRRYFTNVAGLGFDGEVVERLDGHYKGMGGTIPYLKEALLTLVTYENKEVRAFFDDLEWRQSATSILVCNGRYFAGGMFVSPHSLPDDGFFDVVTLNNLGRLEFLANMLRVYNGTHLSHPKVNAYRAREVRVESRQRMVIQADGELIGLAPVTFRVLPKILRVRV